MSERQTLFDAFRDPPFGWDYSTKATKFTTDHGELRSLDGAKAEPFTESDVAEVLYHGNTGADDWDGTEAAVIRLHDGRLVAWQTWWGPTGSGFSEDAYGGDADLWFANSGNLAKLVLQALDDQGRELAGLPRGGFGV